MTELPRVANFEKVTYERFNKDWEDTFGEGTTVYGVDSRQSYCGIDIPKRSTSGSAGYDFVSPIDFVLYPSEEIKIPTGIRCVMDDGYVLFIFPRSSLGFKYNLMCCNTVPIIDSDYYKSDTEGHIFIKLINRGKKPLSIKRGDKIVQGILVPFCYTYDDDVDTVRNGGMGSTGR